jgi:putative IMPACT (imprinted ancient) family translation regulator
MALEAASIIEKTIDVSFKITFDYKNINKVMRIIKEKKLNVISQKMELNCEIEISTRKKNAEEISDIFETLFEVFLIKL